MILEYWLCHCKSMFFHPLWHTFFSLFNHSVNEAMQWFQCKTNFDLLPIVSSSVQFHWQSVKYLIDVLQCHFLLTLVALILLWLVTTWEMYLFFFWVPHKITRSLKKGNPFLLFTTVSLLLSYWHIVGSQNYLTNDCPHA